MKKRISVLVLALILISGTALGAEKMDWIGVNSSLEIIEMIYFGEIDEVKMVQGILRSLDPYSDLVIYSDKELGNGGIGVILAKHREGAIVHEVTKGGPGEKAGLKLGDIIVEVNQVKLKNKSLDEIVGLVRGEPGKGLSLKYKRDGQVKDLKLVRVSLDEEDIKYWLEGDIGVIKINSFEEGVDKETEKALKEFKSKNIKKIILDLRDNPGGDMDVSIKIADLFIENGVITRVKRKGSVENKIYEARKKKLDFKLAVLVNDESASASEIVAGAIKDNKAGYLIGDKTYGKGLIQSILPLGDLGEEMGYFKITSGEYHRPSGAKVHGIGIEPDLVVLEEEDQFKKAIEYLNK